MKVNIKRIKDTAIIPTYETTQAAGADLYACIDNPIMIAAHQTEIIDTGIAIEIPIGYVGLIYARSGISIKEGLAPANKVGVIDADYRGEIKVALHNHSNESKIINPKDRIAQIVIAPYLTVQFREVKELKKTQRGNKGFGSTGR